MNRLVTVAELVKTCRLKDTRPVAAIPLNSVFPDMPIYNIRLADHVPKDETGLDTLDAFRYAVKRAFFKIQVALYRVFPPMQPGLPAIDSDPYRALHQAYTDSHQRTASRAARKVGSPKTLRFPVLPLELHGSADLARLAVCGPYAGYLRKVFDDRYEWDLRELAQYEHRDGLYRLGARVVFHRDLSTPMPRLQTVQIDTELGTSRPGDRSWPLAKQIALCALTTHTTLVRHWNWTHLVGGEAIALATRNAFPEDHPLCRLLWPHMAGTHQSNRFGSMAQLGPGGDYEAIFSFTARGMYRLFDDSYKMYRFAVADPREDAAARGLAHAGVELPTQRNLEALFDVMQAHARNYIARYYETDEAVRTNAPIRQWIEDLNRLIPHGVVPPPTDLTVEALERVVACILYFVTTYHELVGASLWNYQLWPHVQPVRVSKDGRPEPVDVYQRLINMNYLLRVIRTPLINDFTSLALDESGRQAFRDFQTSLIVLQRRMESEPPAVWKIYPQDLEANINA